MGKTASNLDLRLSAQLLQRKWAWFVALGMLIFCLGILAFGNLAWATTVTVFYVGAMMTLAGAIQIVNAFQVRSWSGFLFLLFSGLFYTLAGVVVFKNPVLAATTLTLLLGFSLLISGAARIWSSFPLYRHSGWGWVLASGVMTMFAGVVFLIDWPTNSLWLLGVILATDLTFQGVAVIAMGTTIKSGSRESSDYSTPAVSAF